MKIREQGRVWELKGTRARESQGVRQQGRRGQERQGGEQNSFGHINEPQKILAEIFKDVTEYQIYP